MFLYRVFLYFSINSKYSFRIIVKYKLFSEIKEKIRFIVDEQPDKNASITDDVNPNHVNKAPHSNIVEEENSEVLQRLAKEYYEIETKLKSL